MQIEAKVERKALSTIDLYAHSGAQMGVKMRENQILVEPFSYDALLEFQCTKEVMDHGSADITMRIKESDQSNYLKELSQEIWVGIKAIGEEGERKTLFCGIVSDYEMKVGDQESILHLHLAGGTSLMDKKNHFRTFQDDRIKAIEIYDTINKGYSEAEVSDNTAQENRIGHMTIQYQETDWQFIKRLAGRHGGYLTPQADRKGCCYSVGLPAGKERNPEKSQTITYRSDAARYHQKKASGMSASRPADEMEMILQSREIYHLGDWIRIKGIPYYLARIISSYQSKELLHTYYFKSEEGLKEMEIKNRQIAGCSFEATVTAIQRDKVKIEIKGDENKTHTARKWFDYATVYSSPDGTGWYCMPEAGDTVRLYVPDEEGESFVLSSVHMESSVSRQNPDYKSLKTKYGKEILFTPETILLTNNKGMMIELSDTDGIYIASDKNILIQAGQNMTVSSQDSSLLIAAQDCVVVKQKGTTITLKDDIKFTGGEFRIQ